MMQKSAEEVVCDYLKGHGYKQKYIAKVLGVRDYTVSDIFCKRRPLKANELVAICLATKTSPNEMLAPLFDS